MELCVIWSTDWAHQLSLTVQQSSGYATRNTVRGAPRDIADKVMPRHRVLCMFEMSSCACKIGRKVSLVQVWALDMQGDNSDRATALW